MFFLNKVKLFIISVFLLFGFTVTAQTTRYVKPVATGTGDGLSWANASASISAMITASASGDQIFVMKGAYTGSISMKEGVKIYGSFQGTETDLTQRVIGTTAADSSRLNNNGAGLTVNNPTALTNASVLDGFYLTNKNAAGTTRNNIVQNGVTTAGRSVSPTFANIIIAGGGGNGAAWATFLTHSPLAQPPL